jgi:hypothetical protein
MAEQDHLWGDLLRDSERSRGSGSDALPLTPGTSGHTFELSFAHREHGSRFVIGTPWRILSQGNRYADDDH